MFTLEQIKKAHEKVKSGADFPKYIKEIKEFGVSKFETFVKDGHTEYCGEGDFTLSSEPKYEELTISVVTDSEKFKKQLKAHQQGETDYYTFCADCAETGIQKWIVEFNKMACTYYDKWK